MKTENVDKTEEARPRRASAHGSASGWAWCRAWLLVLALWIIHITPTSASGFMDLLDTVIGLFLATWLVRLREI